MKRNNRAFIFYIRLGIGHCVESSTNMDDWRYIKEMSERHGLQAIVVDGIDKLPESQRPPKDLLLQWIGEVLHNYEFRYELYRRTIVEMAGFYREHGIKMMVLKGYACSLDWPKPEHRPCGDIDIWQFGKQNDGDSLLESEKGIKIDKSHHHHTVYEWGGFIVENHYDFVNVYAHKSSAELEKVFKELGQDDMHFVDIKDASTGSATKVYLPSPNLHALFLLRHMVSHFAAAEISLRQVLDWGFFVEKHTNDVDWKWLLEVLDKFHMKEFFNLINAICVDDLGFAADIFPEVRFVPELKEKVLVDILDPAYGAAEPASFFPRIIYKYRRWQGNAWKQKLCYNESRWESFWTGLWAKVLKPASI